MAPAVEPQPIVFNIELDDNGRKATLTVPLDTTDAEILGIIGVVTSQLRTVLAGQRAQQLVIARAPLMRV